MSTVPPVPGLRRPVSGAAAPLFPAQRRVAIVAAHFPPSNLAGVHRARLWAQHLAESGWTPVIVTTHWRHYEEPLDWDLARLVAPHVKVLRTPALPVRPVRLVGDLGIRAFWWHWQTLRRLVAAGAVDFVHITVPSFYSAPLGRLLYRERPLPYGIDYIDPWVHPWPEADKVASKAWLSLKLGERLEPFAVREASLITGVAEGYYAGVLERNPHLSKQAVCAAMPYGNSETDFEAARTLNRRTFLFDPADGCFHMLYAGAMLPKGAAVLDRLLAALALLRDLDPEAIARLRLHFAGTGTSPGDPRGHNILPRARRLGLEPWVREHPRRIGYLDVLNHLCRAQAVLIAGSTEPHYSPSKVFQAVQARRPVFALLHERSPAVPVLENSRAGRVIRLSERELPPPESIAAALRDFLRDPGYRPEAVDWRAFEAHSARNSARALASALDAARDRFGARAGSGGRAP